MDEQYLKRFEFKMSNFGIHCNSFLILFSQIEINQLQWEISQGDPLQLSDMIAIEIQYRETHLWDILNFDSKF